MAEPSLPSHGARGPEDWTPTEEPLGLLAEESEPEKVHTYDLSRRPEVVCYDRKRLLRHLAFWFVSQPSVVVVRRVAEGGNVTPTLLLLDLLSFTSMVFPEFLNAASLARRAWLLIGIVSVVVLIIFVAVSRGHRHSFARSEISRLNAVVIGGIVVVTVVPDRASVEANGLLQWDEYWSAVKGQ
ncbi:hypothetical protein CEP54_014261 [Fusarium duplospermum]|uniref:Uncharacterized protein n=1 Tax=Fusarium duplospermum TaxID=1325734 RepID=A0A428NXE9_9HYPO|nr:hypothetical protein CEP54_014261 [Fusarium duplospermum]